MSQFEKELSELINKHCGENASNTPDFILSSYLNDCLTAYNKATNWRIKWYSPEGVPQEELFTGPAAIRESKESK